MQISDNLRGAAFMTGSMVAFTVNDTFLKGLSLDIPLAQTLFVRGVGTTLFLLMISYFMGQLRFDFSRKDWLLILIRAAAEIAAAYLFLTALFHMPIANVSAIMQVMPLSVALAAAVFFREPLGWRRVLAIAVGFGGVLLIVRPGTEGFNIYSAYVLAAVVCVTVRDLAARRLSRSVPSTMVAVIASAAVALSGGGLTAASDWVTLDQSAWLNTIGAMFMVVLGYLFSVTAMRIGEIGFVAPFRYASLIAALILGYLVFGDWPRNITLLGAFIVVATGMFTLYREQVAAKRLRKLSQSGPH
uniref:DMT family transporter n=2 Tax=Yoonia sp. TaxID=2212373 RepID=UPI004047AF86